MGRGAVGKQAVLGLREREGEVMARPIPNADAQNIVGTINSHVEIGSTIYSDDHRAYKQLDGLYYKHDSVKHSQKEYVRGCSSYQLHRERVGYPRTLHYWCPPPCFQQAP